MSVYLFLAIIPIMAVWTLGYFLISIGCTLEAGLVPRCVQWWKETVYLLGGTALLYLFTIHCCLRWIKHQWFGHIREIEKSVWGGIKERLKLRKV